jgi:hypothetical protein
MENPLNQREKTLPKGQRGAFQYFLKVVSTEYSFLDPKREEIRTNQYSSTQHFLKMTPKGQSELPSVSFSYEFSPIMFRIEQSTKSMKHFATSVCAIIGGVFTVHASIDLYISISISIYRYISFGFLCVCVLKCNFIYMGKRMPSSVPLRDVI